ncbi:MAG: PLP-dependent cysteine synthase family protein [Candidatus Aminicenantia bacterium]
MEGEFSKTMLDLIGNTPLVEIKKLNPNPKVKILAKLEGYNPTGSLKDRIVKFMVEKAEEKGTLTKEKTIIEASSGNTGISLAMIGAIKGYKVKIFMLETKSRERRVLMKLWGAEVVLTSGDNPHSHIEACEELYSREKEKYYYLNQNGDENNSLAHYLTTGQEILDQTKGKADVFVAGLGTAGTLMGVSRKLKEHNDRIKVISVEPVTGMSRIEGLLHMDGSYIPPIYCSALIDEMVRVSDEDAFRATRLLTLEEGIFAGISSGACLHAAWQVAQKMTKGIIVVLFADRGERYLSSPLYADFTQ